MPTPDSPPSPWFSGPPPVTGHYWFSFSADRRGLLLARVSVRLQNHPDERPGEVEARIDGYGVVDLRYAGYRWCGPVPVPGHEPWMGHDASLDYRDVRVLPPPTMLDRVPLMVAPPRPPAESIVLGKFPVPACWYTLIGALFVNGENEEDVWLDNGDDTNPIGVKDAAGRQVGVDDPAPYTNDARTVEAKLGSFIVVASLISGDCGYWGDLMVTEADGRVVYTDHEVLDEFPGRCAFEVDGQRYTVKFEPVGS